MIHVVYNIFGCQNYCPHLLDKIELCVLSIIVTNTHSVFHTQIHTCPQFVYLSSVGGDYTYVCVLFTCICEFVCAYICFLVHTLQPKRNALTNWAI